MSTAERIEDLAKEAGRMVELRYSPAINQWHVKISGDTGSNAIGNTPDQALDRLESRRARERQGAAR